MKHFASHPCLVAGFVCLTALTPGVAAQSACQTSKPIPVSDLGAQAGARYHGDGLSVLPTPEGARLRCVFQRLEVTVPLLDDWEKGWKKRLKPEMLKFEVAMPKAVAA